MTNPRANNSRRDSDIVKTEYEMDPICRKDYSDCTVACLQNSLRNIVQIPNSQQSKFRRVHSKENEHLCKTEVLSNTGCVEKQLNITTQLGLPA